MFIQYACFFELHVFKYTRIFVQASPERVRASRRPGVRQRARAFRGHCARSVWRFGARTPAHRRRARRRRQRGPRRDPATSSRRTSKQHLQPSVAASVYFTLEFRVSVYQWNQERTVIRLLLWYIQNTRWHYATVWVCLFVYYCVCHAMCTGI